MELGRVGVWSRQFRSDDHDGAARAAAEIEALGFGALWIPGAAGGDILGDVGRVLGATRRLVVATGILNIWMHDPTDVAAGHVRLEAAHEGRFLLGLGVSHSLLIDADGTRRYGQPLAVMARYLDALDAAPEPVPVGQRVLAALGPRMLELARTRSAGAHPYLTDPTHTARARAALGDDALLAPEQKVILLADPARARALARESLARFFDLPNYVRNLRRLGYEEDDFVGGGSDRLVDGLYAWGDAPAVAARVREHLDAGADHVCLQVLTEGPDRHPVEEWRMLAAELAPLITPPAPAPGAG